MDRPYRAAVIGTGRIGMLLESDPIRIKPATHFGMWDAHPDTDLVAVCDAEPEKLTQANKLKPGIEIFSDPSDLLRSVRPDLISISTWRDSHYDIMKLAIRERVPVIVLEKPIAEEVTHAVEIVQEADDAGIHVLVNHRRRFDPLVRELADQLRAGLIGDILQVNCLYVFGLVTTGTHVIDTLRMLLGAIAGEIAWVSAYRNAFDTFHPDDDPDVDAVVVFENGLKVCMQSMNMKDYDIFDFYIHGRGGKVVLKSIGRVIEHYPVVESPEHEGFTELSDRPAECRGGAPRNLFMELADNAVACLEGRATSMSTAIDSLRALEVLNALQKSTAEMGTITPVNYTSDVG